VVDGMTALVDALPPVLAFVCGQSPPGFPIPPQPLWESTVGFISVFLGAVFLIGASSRNLAVGAVGAYVMFVHYGVELQNTMIQQTMYVSLVIVALGLAFKLWNTELGGAA
jgi:hypothetical protein